MNQPFWRRFSGIGSAWTFAARAKARRAVIRMVYLMFMNLKNEGNVTNRGALHV
jgi:hypothetical protein